MNDTDSLKVILLMVVLPSAVARGRAGWKESKELREEVRPFPWPVGTNHFRKDVRRIFREQVMWFCHAGQQKSTEARLFFLAHRSCLSLLLL